MSIIQGPFSVAPCQTLISRFATFCIAVRFAPRATDGPVGSVTSCAALPAVGSGGGGARAAELTASSVAAGGAGGAAGVCLGLGLETGEFGAEPKSGCTFSLWVTSGAAAGGGVDSFGSLQSACTTRSPVTTTTTPESQRRTRSEDATLRLCEPARRAVLGADRFRGRSC